MTKSRIPSLRLKTLSSSRWLVLVPALLGFLVTSSSAEADAFGVWEFSKSCLAAEGGQVVLVEGGFRLTGADGGTCAGKSHWVKLEAVIPEGTTEVGFQWGYQTNDGANYDPPQIVLNGVVTQLTNQSSASGSGLVTVEAGDVFAFRQFSTDSCCQPGNLTITGLTLGLGEWVSTTSSTTTVTTSTITVPETTVPATVLTTTTVQETTTTTSTSTTLSLPQTSVPTTTTEPPQTTTTTQETISPVTSTSSTTTTIQTTTTTLPPVESTSTTTTTEPTPAPTTTAKPQSETTTTTSTTSTLPPVTTSQPNVTTTILSSSDEPEPLTQTELLSTLEALSEATPEAIEAIVETVLTKELNTSQATLLIATPAVLENITPTQAEQLFEQITPTELSPDEAEAVVAAVQEAPSSVRKAFESVLNIFQGFADTYVPLNSTVPVKTRRALIALGAVFLTVAPAPTRRIR